MRVLLVGDASYPKVRRGLDELEPWLAERTELVGRVDTRDGIFPEGALDLAVILGGDGAILGAATRLGAREVPVIGIRTGHFGFLAELEPITCKSYLTRILAGEGHVVERMTLSLEVRRGGRPVVLDHAVNDAVVTAAEPARMVGLDLQVDGEHVATYRGDGLVLATPVGSTAHSLAAGGPVVEPSSEALLVTPLASHTLASRPLVLGANRRLLVRPSRNRPSAAAVAVDGQRTYAVQPEDSVHVARSDRPLRIMTIVERSFFETLRRKFHWSGSVTIEREGEDL